MPKKATKKPVSKATKKRPAVKKKPTAAAVKKVKTPNRTGYRLFGDVFPRDSTKAAISPENLAALKELVLFCSEKKVTEINLGFASVKFAQAGEKETAPSLPLAEPQDPDDEAASFIRAEEVERMSMAAAQWSSGAK